MEKITEIKKFNELIKYIKEYIKSRRSDIVEKRLSEIITEKSLLTVCKNDTVTDSLYFRSDLKSEHDDYLDDILQVRKNLEKMVEVEAKKQGIKAYKIKHDFYTEECGYLEFNVHASFERAATEDEIFNRARTLAYNHFVNSDDYKNLPEFDITDYCHLDLVDDKFIEFEYGQNKFVFELKVKNIEKYLSKSQADKEHYLMSAGQSLTLFNIE